MANYLSEIIKTEMPLAPTAPRLNSKIERERLEASMI
jgi:hypothetical protein